MDLALWLNFPTARAMARKLLSSFRVGKDLSLSGTDGEREL